MQGGARRQEVHLQEVGQVQGGAAKEVVGTQVTVPHLQHQGRGSCLVHLKSVMSSVKLPLAKLPHRRQFGWRLYDLRPSPLQYSAVQCSAVQCSAVLRAVQCCVQCSV